jgi:hypothetical protein
MKNIKHLFLVLCLIGTCVNPGLAIAGDEEVAALKAQIEMLSRKLDAMDSKMQTMEKPAPGAQTTYIPPTEESKSGFLRAMEDIHMGGYIDTQYQGTFENSDGQNVGRVFSDRAKDTFSMNAAKIWFEKAANPEGGAGFRIDLLLGSDARYIDFNDGGTTAADEFAIEQAYVQFIAPLGFWGDSNVLPHSIEFKAGRFTTMAGYEVIEGPSNWNISRSVTFGYALPFTHTGVRATFGLFNDYLTVTTGINNGWDSDIGSHTYKTFEGAVSFKPFKNVTWTTASYIGPSETGAAGPAIGNRFLVTNVLNWDVNDKLALGGDFDFGNQRRVDLDGSDVFQSAQWYGTAGYAKYQFTEKFAAAYRFELFRDADRYRNWTGVGTAGATTDVANTLTLEYKISEHLIGRGEYRIDYAHAGDGDVFNGSHAQNTMGGQLIYMF